MIVQELKCCAQEDGEPQKAFEQKWGVWADVHFRKAVLVAERRGNMYFVVYAFMLFILRKGHSPWWSSVHDAPGLVFFRAAVTCPMAHFDELCLLSFSGLCCVARARATFSVAMAVWSPGNLEEDEAWSGSRLLPGFMVAGHRETRAWMSAA